MQKKLYIGGLPYSSNADSLKKAFESCGTVESSVIITDKMTGKSRGFGFVEMSSEAEAQKAVEIWNDKEFEGRKLTVNIARPMEDRSNDRRRV